LDRGVAFDICSVSYGLSFIQGKRRGVERLGEGWCLVWIGIDKMLGGDLNRQDTWKGFEWTRCFEWI
jgi:hypothetical protein